MTDKGQRISYLYSKYDAAALAAALLSAGTRKEEA
jgi:hypothetical protein